MVSLAPKGQYDFLNPQIKQIGEGHPGDEDYFDPEGEEAQHSRLPMPAATPMLPPVTPKRLTRLMETDGQTGETGCPSQGEVAGLLGEGCGHLVPAH